MLDLETVSKNIMDCKKNQSIGHGWKKDWLFLIDNDQQVEIHLLWICDVNKQWLRGKMTMLGNVEEKKRRERQ